MAIHIADPAVAARLDLKLIVALFIGGGGAAYGSAGGREIHAAICEREFVSLNTARTLLYRVFAKTGVSRQAELVRLALVACSAGTGEN